MISATMFPEPVSGLDIHSKTTSTLYLTWTYQFDESSPKTGVQIEVTKGEDLMRNITLPGFATTTILSFLEPLTMYTIAVYVVNANGRSPPSTVQAFTLSLSKFLFLWTK